MFGDIKDTNKWARLKWSEVVEIKNGKDYKNNISNTGDGYPVYGSGGVMKGIAVDSYLCPKNTIIVGRKGSINNPLLVEEECWNVDTAFGVVCKKEKINYIYFYEFCKMFDFESLNKATTLPSTTKKDLLKIDINIPPLELQNQFADFFNQVDKSRFVVLYSFTIEIFIYDILSYNKKG